MEGGKGDSDVCIRACGEREREKRRVLGGTCEGGKGKCSNDSNNKKPKTCEYSCTFFFFFYSAFGII